MNIFDAVRTRRSVRQFTPRSVAREEIERLLEVAVLGPNHRLTQPWRFRVLGPEARRAYGEVLGLRKAKKIEAPDAAAALVEKVAAAEAGLPAMLVVSVQLDDNPEIREEDYAATMIGVGHLLLAACAMGLGTHLKTGAVMDDPRTRAALGVPERERIVALVQIGEPAEVSPPRSRRPASELTQWLP